MLLEDMTVHPDRHGLLEEPQRQHKRIQCVDAYTKLAPILGKRALVLNCRGIMVL